MINPGMKLGPFIIEEEIGSGAMGAVYRAQYRDKNLRVAVKVMAPGIGSSDTAQARFQREADILKNLQHPNIVRLFAIGRYKNSPFYAMEFIEGETLEQTLQRRSRLPWEELVRIGRQLCSALQHAHDKEVVHRDLKPSNLMMLPDGTMKLTDFGIAKALDMSGLTATNCTVGTASYMSPEQCRGEKDISHKSDLYSMGILFYELVTGRKPFFAESTMDMFMQHVKGKFKRPTEFEPNMPVWLDNLICQLLEKKPEDRPISARVVGDTLADIVEKVESQQSAGMERATARGKQKGQHRPKLDDTDRAAARTLLSKRKKETQVPFYQQGWFTLMALLVVLAGLGYGAYYVFFTPPSLESLRNQTKNILDAGDTYENWMAARDGPLHAFQVHHADAKGPTADLMRQWSEEINGKIGEVQMLNRYAQKKSPDAKGEKAARDALYEEDRGHLNEAMTAWKELVAKQVKDSDVEKRDWALVAKRRLQQLEQLSAEWGTLYKKVQKDKDYAGPSPEEKLAVEAFRAEIDNKMEMAKELWDRLKVKTIDDEEQRGWFLLAAYRLHELSKKPKTGQEK